MRRHIPTGRLAVLLLLLLALATPTPATAADDGQAPSGGLSFNAAGPAGPNSIARQTLVVGEYLYWKLSLKTGQLLDIQAQATLPEKYPSGVTDAWSVQVFDPARKPLPCERSGAQPQAFLHSAPVGNTNVRCKAGRETRIAVPGSYYVQVAVADPAEQARGTGIPIEVTFGVGGSPQSPDETFNPGTPSPGAIVPGGKTPTRKPESPSTPAATNSIGRNTGTTDSGSDLWPTLALLTLALAAGYLGMAALQRRAHRRPAGPASAAAPPQPPPPPTAPPPPRRDAPPSPPPADPRR